MYLHDWRDTAECKEPTAVQGVNGVPREQKAWSLQNDKCGDRTVTTSLEALIRAHRPHEIASLLFSHRISILLAVGVIGAEETLPSLPGSFPFMFYVHWGQHPRNSPTLAEGYLVHALSLSSAQEDHKKEHVCCRGSIQRTRCNWDIRVVTS